MYTLKSNHDGSFSLEPPPSSEAKVKHITISFPEITMRAGSGTTYHVSGPAKASITIEYEDLETEIINDVAVVL